jgi:hypothetical protein
MNIAFRVPAGSYQPGQHAIVEKQVHAIEKN